MMKVIMTNAYEFYSTTMPKAFWQGEVAKLWASWCVVMKVATNNTHCVQFL